MTSVSKYYDSNGIIRRKPNFNQFFNHLIRTYGKSSISLYRCEMAEALKMIYVSIKGKIILMK